MAAAASEQVRGHRGALALATRAAARLVLLGGLGGASAAQADINRSLVRAEPGVPPAGGPLAQAFATARDALVHVFVEVRGQTTFKIERPGSGVVITPDGLVVTLWDLVREADGATDKSLFVQIAGGADAERRPDASREGAEKLSAEKLGAGRLGAKCLGHDRASGLALLQVDLPAGRTLPFVPLGGDPEPGDPVAVLSLPDGEDHVAFAGVVANAVGPVQAEGSAHRESLAYPRDAILVTDAAIQARSHGGALLSASGALLGVCSAVLVAPDVVLPSLDDLKRPSFGFVIPARTLRAAFAAAHRATAAPVPPRSAAARAVAKVQDSIVAVFGAAKPDAARPLLGGSDPLATQRRAGVGSGVVVASSGLVLTNRHLVAQAAAVTVTFRDGASFAARVLTSDAATNTALLAVALPAGRTVTPIACGSAAAIAVGETVLALGNPEGHTLTVRQGIVSALRTARGGRGAEITGVQTDAGLGNHNAGGALISLAGELLAIADGGVRDKVEEAFAQRGDHAKLETSLDLSPAIDVLRVTYRSEFDRHAGTNASLARPGPHSPRPLSGIAAAVARTAGAMLNVYVEVTAAPQAEDNPFASEPAVTIPEGLGSGVLIDASGLALSNWHVVDSATEPDGSMRKDRVVRARLRDGRVFQADVLSTSREEDLALLRLRLAGTDRVDVVRLGASADLAVGDQTIAIGNPHGRADTVTAGIVTAKNQAIRVQGRWAKLRHLLETDAAINAGNSGGALLDGEGRLIGINSAGGSVHAVTGYSISVDHVREKVSSLLLSPEKLRSAYAGLSVTDHAGKVVVQAVDRHGPAAAAGVAPGDVLCALAGEPVQWTVGYALAWLQIDPGKAVPLVIERAGTRATKTVVPLSAAAWAVFRQAGLELSELAMAADPDAVRAAALAGYRRFTRDPTASPAELPEMLVRVDRVHPAVQDKVDVRAGDLLLGVTVRDAVTEADHLLRFQEVPDVQRCFNAHATYEGTALTAWICRGTDVRSVEITAKRLLW